MNKKGLLNTNQTISKDTSNVDELLELVEIYYAISKELLSYRKEHNLTQEELAKKLRMNQTMISKLESGRYNPTFKLIHQISRKLDNSNKFFSDVLLNILKEIKNVSTTKYTHNLNNKNYNYESEGNIIYITKKYINEKGGFNNECNSKFTNVG